MNRFWRRLTKYRRTWLALGVFVALWALAPSAAKHLLIWGLEKQTQAQVKVDQVTLGWWAGRVTVSGLRIEAKQTSALAFDRLLLDLSWGALWQRNWLVQQLHLSQAQVTVELDDSARPLRIAGWRLPDGAAPSPSDVEAGKAQRWGIGIDALRIDQLQVIVQRPHTQHTFQLKQVQLNGLQSWQPERSAELVMEALLVQPSRADARLNLKLAATPFAQAPVYAGTLGLNALALSDWQTLLPASDSQISGQFAMNGDFEWHHGKRRFQWDGALALVDPSVSVAPQSLIQADGFDWSGQVNARLDAKTNQLSADGRLDLKGGRLRTDAQALTWRGLQWQGTAEAAIPSQDHASLPLAWQTQGTLSMTGVAGQVAHYRPELERLAWQGSVSGQGVQPNAMSLRSHGQLTLTQMSMATLLASSDAPKEWAHIKRLHSDYQVTRQPQANHTGLTVSLNQVAVNALSVGALGEANQKTGAETIENWVSLETLTVPDVTFQEGETPRLSAGLVTIEGGDIHATLDANQRLRQWERLRPLMGTDAAAQKPRTETDAPAEPASESVSWGLAGLQVNDLALHLELAAQARFIQTLFTLSSLEMGRLDSTQPDQTTPIELKAQINERAELDASLQGTWLQPYQNTTFDVTLSHLDLYPYSSLIETALDLAVERGRLSLNTDGQIEEGELQSNNRLFLNGFQLVDGQGEAGLSGIQVGLNLLRDKNDRIELDVPIQGRIDSPEFQLDDVIQTALFKAIRGGTKTMLALALQPYGAIYLAAEYAFNKATAMTFEPVVFAPGKPDLTQPMQQYLLKVAKVVQKQPELLLNLCGYFTPSDRQYWQHKKLTGEVLSQKLLQLAQTRQQKVEMFLMQEGGLAASQLTLCQPKERDLDKPGVLLGL
ncbi:DUF748 domain-containing protein [Thiomicrospira sp. WB1]|uniref:DUF748 domain-containing protein n=1 Tax=Thiomicrospira sp. WB1 TaxID=1685380 RepID=UPI00074AE157|nr:DUF748 domain-containing protein [Thiomicrospira sp. WB1]KUJ72992.1 hypothetical protein AVO41_04310 [Thiomicrospira sp. WB1]